MIGVLIWISVIIFIFYNEFFFACLNFLLTIRFFSDWYSPLLNAWPSYRGKCGRLILGLLPFLTLVILYPVLVNMASYDVVGVWVIFYLLMGYAWIYGGLFLFERC